MSDAAWDDDSWEVQPAGKIQELRGVKSGAAAHALIASPPPPGPCLPAGTATIPGGQEPGEPAVGQSRLAGGASASEVRTPLTACLLHGHAACAINETWTACGMQFVDEDAVEEEQLQDFKKPSQVCRRAT